MGVSNSWMCVKVGMVPIHGVIRQSQVPKNGDRTKMSVRDILTRTFPILNNLLKTRVSCLGQSYTELSSAHSGLYLGCIF